MKSYCKMMKNVMQLLIVLLLCAYWVIPENTIPQAASWNSEGEGGFLGLEFRRRGGVTQFGIPKAWGGCFSSEFSEFPAERRQKLRLKSLTC